jgi:hypothetical protein
MTDRQKDLLLTLVSRVSQEIMHQRRSLQLPEVVSAFDRIDREVSHLYSVISDMPASDREHGTAPQERSEPELWIPPPDPAYLQRSRGMPGTAAKKMVRVSVVGMIAFACTLGLILLAEPDMPADSRILLSAFFAAIFMVLAGIKS